MLVITDMDSFLPLITTTNTKDRLTIGAQILEYLGDESNSLTCSDIGALADTLILWLQSSNFKIVQLDLDILTELIKRMGSDFQPYISTLVPHLLDKLGDSKEVIREKTSILFSKLVEDGVLSPQSLFDRITLPSFTHKNSNVREQVMLLLVEIVNTYGASTLTISKLVAHIVKLLADPNANVRQTAFDTLCHLYKHVGARLKMDLQKKYSIPHNKLSALMAKFDEIKADGGVIADETDRVCERTAFRPPITPSALNASYAKKSIPVRQAGAVDEDMFSKSFEDVPQVQIYSAREVEEYLRKAEIIEKTNEDWKKRVNALKSIRSVMIAGGLEYEEFYTNIMDLLPTFEIALKDLRSQVVRETCITIAYLSKHLTNKFDRFAEAILANLINLIQNSAKVVASSGLVCIRYLLQHTHTPRFIPIIADGLKSKSKEIRRACCKFVNFILQTWPVVMLEKHAAVIQEVIKKGIMDADPEARLHSRNSYADFSVYFPELAESLKNSLDHSYRKMLFSNSQTGSNSSLSKIECKPISGPRVYGSPGCRSTSAIDLQAVKRAKSRSQYTSVERFKFIPIPSKKPVIEPRQGRSTTRTSLSQPTSRSGSPSAKASHSTESTPRSRRSSTDTSSRDSSLNHSGFKSMLPVRKSLSAQKSCPRNENELPTITGEYIKPEEHENLDRDSTSYDSGISQMSSGEHFDLPDCQKDSDMLKTLIEELSNADEQTKKQLLEKIKKLVKEGPPDMIVTHFKSLLGKMITFISESQLPSIKETTLLLLQTIVKRKTVNFLLKQFSDLIIIRVITVCADECKDVSKTAESCAVTLSVHLPPDSVIRVIVPLITSETKAIKLVSIKMLTCIIECSDDALTSEYVDHIMPVLLISYDDPESIVRKAAVYCIVALHKHSEETRSLIQPYVNRLQKPKQKLLELYIRRAEQSCSMPVSPRCG